MAKPRAIHPKNVPARKDASRGTLSDLTKLSRGQEGRRITQSNIRRAFPAVRAARITAGDTATQATARAAREVGLTTNTRRSGIYKGASVIRGGRSKPNQQKPVARL